MPSPRPATLLTGASSGIGAALAPHFAREGRNTLVLVARRAEPMEALAASLRQQHGSEVVVIPADLQAPGAAARLLGELDRLGLYADTLVNNAGYGLSGRFTDMDLGRITGMMQLNMTALIELTYGVLPGMRARHQGRIMNVASIAAFQPCPKFAAYGATKAFVLSFSEALAIELEKDGVTVTAVCPGSTATGFHDVSGSTTSLAAKLMDTADTVAASGYKALVAGDRVVVTGLLNKPVRLVNRLLPRDWTARMTGLLMASH